MFKISSILNSNQMKLFAENKIIVSD